MSTTLWMLAFLVTEDKRNFLDQQDSDTCKEKRGGQRIAHILMLRNSLSLHFESSRPVL